MNSLVNDAVIGKKDVNYAGLALALDSTGLGVFDAFFASLSMILVSEVRLHILSLLYYSPNYTYITLKLGLSCILLISSRSNHTMMFLTDDNLARLEMRLLL